MKEYPRIIFFGTPDFAVTSLEALIHAEYNIVGVVTAPDKKAGRGMKITSSPVKQFALRNNLFLLQPEDLQDPSFHNQLKILQPELQVVVAFRLLPRVVWSLPSLGTFNLHASLLPQYRGAAPINRVIINGEKETGVTTFFLDDKIDTGNIIFHKETTIEAGETAGDLHDRLKITGADLVVQTVDAISKHEFNRISQEILIPPGLILKKAPKIQKDECKINWNEKATVIYNFIRGLSPHPGAFTTITSLDGKSHFLKVYKALPEHFSHSLSPGQIDTDGKTYFKVAVIDGYILLVEVQLSGRKMMQIGEFLRGFDSGFV
jgi:methionyl-tRNA formyltransferase